MALAPQCLNQQTGYSFVQLKGCGIHKLPYSARTAFDTTSALGQIEKNSVRAYVFRFALELGHCSTQSACLKRANPGLPLNEIISPGADPDRERIMRKRVQMPVQILKPFTFVPQPKFNVDPLLIKRERCLITDAPYRHFSSCHFGEG